MARIQILELPVEHHGDDMTTPFVLIIDEYEPTEVSADWAQESDVLRLQEFADKIGARATLVVKDTMQIPANTVAVDPDGTPVRLHFEGDFTKLREQVNDEAAAMAARFRIGERR